MRRRQVAFLYLDHPCRTKEINETRPYRNGNNRATTHSLMQDSGQLRYVTCCLCDMLPLKVVRPYPCHPDQQSSRWRSTKASRAKTSPREPASTIPVFATAARDKHRLCDAPQSARLRIRQRMKNDSQVQCPPFRPERSDRPTPRELAHDS